MAQDTLERIKLALNDRYRIERELGRGGMATVYLGHDLRHDREVAIKVLHPELAASIGSDRFEREIKLAAKLQHPHILGLYESGEAGGLLFYVMPFVKGESLRDRLDREPQLPIDDAVQITLEVADALGLAHSLGIVHRDIKPENVLLANGHALVADFGIARAATEGGAQKLTQTGMALGTPVYMAPEQSMGEVVGPTADIYSMGCMLYEMLAGEPPFTGKSPQAIMARHAMENVPSIRIVRGTVPEEVEDAIFAAMAKTPADRPQTAAKFAEFFGVPAGATATRRAALRHTASRRVPTSAVPAYATDPDHALPPVWKRPPIIVAAVGILVLAGFGAWRLAGSKPPPAASLDPAIKRVAVLYFADNSPDHRLRPLADGLTEALIKTLSQVRTLSVVSRNGVEPFRGADVPPDSVARVVKAGTLVTGSVEPQGKNLIRVTTILRDGHGSDVGRRSNFVVPANQIFAAEDSLAQEVARTLRSWLGQEVQLREVQGGTSNAAAWNLVREAEEKHKDAKAAMDSDRQRGAVLYAEADSLLQQAEAADSRWIEPIVLRGELAYEQAIAQPDPKQRAPIVDRGLATAGRALAIDGSNAKALAVRGELEFAQWQLNASPDQHTRAELLKAAKADLESATRTDPTLASAYAALSVVDYSETPADVFSALRDARAAYEADAFLSNSDYILTRLFWTSYDTEAFAEATKWCDEGGRRFPRDPRFVFCQLWLGLNPLPPDIDRAWKLADRIDSLAPAAKRPYQTRLARMIVGGVIGRAAKAAKTAGGSAAKLLADSANRVLIAARGDATVDPEHELPGYEAIMRVQQGDVDGAIKLLKQYVAVNPDHSFEVAGNVHWWWRDLRSNPGFEALLSKRR